MGLTTYPIAVSSRHLQQDHVQVWCADLDQVSAADFEPILSADERTRAARYHAPQHRDRFTAARGILRKLLSDYVEIAPSEIIFAHNDHGKPYLAGNPIHFNISHSGPMLLIAVAPHEVGVDIECIRELLDIIDIAEKYFTAIEAGELREMTAPQRVARFFELWTKKEASCKACGLGIAHGLKSCELSSGQWYVDKIDAPSGYAAALAVACPFVRVQRLAWSDWGTI